MLLRNIPFLSTNLLCCSLLPAWVAGQDNSIPSAQKVIEAYVNALGGKIKLQKVETVSVTAKSDKLFGSPSSLHVLWKNGKFLVKETGVRGVKNQVSRPIRNLSARSKPAIIRERKDIQPVII